MRARRCIYYWQIMTSAYWILVYDCDPSLEMLICELKEEFLLQINFVMPPVGYWVAEASRAILSLIPQFGSSWSRYMNLVTNWCNLIRSVSHKNWSYQQYGILPIVLNISGVMFFFFLFKKVSLEIFSLK